MSWIRRYQQFLEDPARVVQWFMLCRQMGIILASIVIARTLPVEDVGTLEMLMLSGYLLTFFWSDALLKGFLATGQKDESRTMATSFFWLFVLGTILSMTVLILGEPWLLPVLVGRPGLEGLKIFALYQVLIIPVWMVPFIGLLKGQNPVLLAVYVLIGPSFSIWFGIHQIPDIRGALIGLMSYALVGFVWVLIQTRFVRHLRLKALLVQIWPATWPLVMYAVSSGLARSFDAWLVARHFDDIQFALFRYGAREFPLAVAFAAGLSTIMIPRLKGSDAIAELQQRSVRLMHMLYPITALLLLLSPFAFGYFFGMTYRPGAAIFNIYLLLALTQLVFPQSILTARGDARLLWYVSVAELAVNVITSIALMPAFGLEGIAWGTVVAFIFEKVALIVICQRKYGIRWHEILPVKTWAMYALWLVMMYMISGWISGI